MNFYFVDCLCSHKEILVDGLVPEYFNSQMELENRYREIILKDVLYFALHLNNKHVIFKKEN